MAVVSRRDPDSRGYFGEFGGRFVPETLVEPVEQLERAYLEVREDPAFAAELARLLRHYVGRPTPVYEAKRLTQAYGGARIFLKREDLTHTGAHKINNALGQALLAGGLTADNVAAACGLVRPYGIDVSSGVESSPGRKDHGRLRALFEALRSVPAERESLPSSARL